MLHADTSVSAGSLPPIIWQIEIRAKKVADIQHEVFNRISHSHEQIPSSHEADADFSSYRDYKSFLSEEVW